MHRMSVNHTCRLRLALCVEVYSNDCNLLVLEWGMFWFRPVFHVNNWGTVSRTWDFTYWRLFSPWAKQEIINYNSEPLKGSHPPHGGEEEYLFKLGRKTKAKIYQPCMVRKNFLSRIGQSRNSLTSRSSQDCKRRKVKISLSQQNWTVIN